MSKWFQIVSFGFLSSVVTGEALAQGTVENLLDQCKAAVKVSNDTTVSEVDLMMKSIACNAYLLGFVDGIVHQKATEQAGTQEINICFPEEGVSVDQLIHIFVNSMEPVPAHWHNRAAVGLGASLAAAFPCDLQPPAK